MAKFEHRGSRKHVLEWIDSADFLPQLNAMLAPTGAHVEVADCRMPRGDGCEIEARLERFGPEALPEIDWTVVRNWWLAHHRGANTPNWDLATTCTVGGKRGLVLVEAKANANEIKREGKFLREIASRNSIANHDKIRGAIDEARQELEARSPGWGISVATHYQLSNRVAFAWRLASLGIPTVLIYLGFLGDSGIRDAGEPFESAGSWEACFDSYAKGVVPATAIEQPIDCGPAPFWILVRSLPGLSVSPPRSR
jgi:hypothetical protein